MATDNGHIYGFRPIRSLHSADLPNVKRAAIADNNAGEINVGDPIKILNTGYWTLCVAGDKADGIVQRIGPYYNGTRMTFGTKLPKATTYGTNFERQSFVYYMPAARTIFECDVNDNTTATTYATYLSYIGENVEMVLGDGTSGPADPKLNISTHAVTNTLSWRIEGISELNFVMDPAGTNFKLYVTPNLTASAPWTILGT